MKRILIWVAIVAALIAMVWFMAHSTAQAPVEASGTLQEPVTANDWTTGGALARTTVVEYADFQCPACAAFHPYIKKILSDYQGQVKWVHREYPLTSIHPNAQISAQAAEAAGKQGKFWEMHNMLFETQVAWSGSNTAAAIFTGYAKQLGLNVEQFTKDLYSDEVKNKIKADIDSGNRSGVEATPSFYLNGEKVTQLQNYADLEQLIKTALGK